MDGETNWYPGSVLPIRAGRYKVRNKPYHKIEMRLSAAPFRYWNGVQWLTYKGGPRSVMGQSPFHEWKGLTECAQKP